jgi:hypothetical protein
VGKPPVALQRSFAHYSEIRMSRSVKASLRTLALSAAASASALAISLGLPSQSRAADLGTPEPLTLVQPAVPAAQNSTANAQPAETTPSMAASRAFMLDDAAAETPNIHGFAELAFKTGYLTPRGLYVQNSGLSFQPVVGLVFPLGDLGPVKKIAFVSGIWNCVNTYEAKSNATTGGWDEMDIFESFSGTIADSFGLNLTYGAWNSPEHAFSTEHNLDLKFTYSDKWFGDSGISINPYVDCWWAISGSSTVILGRHGGTGYFEPGIVPTYTYKGISSYPITFTLPTYFSIGPSHYWDATNTYSNSIFGLASVSVDMQVPLAFIPAKYGFWHADAGFTYDYLINDALVHAGTLASGNTDHNCYLGSVGFGVNF